MFRMSTALALALCLSTPALAQQGHMGGMSHREGADGTGHDEVNMPGLFGENATPEESAELDFVAEDILLGGGIGMGFRESDAELRAKFDAAIQSMKEDGSLNALIEKWDVGETF